MIEIGVVVGYVAAFLARKAAGLAGRAVNDVVDAKLDQLYEVVRQRLGGEPALTRLGEPGGDTPRTRQRVELALQDAVEADPGLAGELERLVDELDAAGGRQVVASAGGIAVGGNVEIRADRGGVAAQRIEGGVSAGYRPEPGEDRPFDPSPGTQPAE